VLFLEELQRDPAPVMARACAHLGIDPAPLADAALPHANQASFPRWPRLAALGRRVQQLAKGAGPGVAGLVQRIGRATRPFRVYSGQPRMDEPTRRALRHRLQQCDAELADWLGRPLPWRTR
jgi:hypothetical protein